MRRGTRRTRPTIGAVVGVLLGTIGLLAGLSPGPVVAESIDDGEQTTTTGEDADTEETEPAQSDEGADQPEDEDLEPADVPLAVWVALIVVLIIAVGWGAVVGSQSSSAADDDAASDEA